MLIVSALAVLALWALIAITLIGIGSALLPRLHTNYSLGDAFWMGLALSVAFLEIWGLVAPLVSSGQRTASAPDSRCGLNGFGPGWRRGQFWLWRCGVSPGMAGGSRTDGSWPRAG
jgi:hypothetical protein